mgnify:CR=1 FL=1
MAKDWEYAKAVKWISEHGGTQKALETVKNYYMEKGFKKGAASKNPVIALVGVSCLAAGVVVTCIGNKIIAKKASKDVFDQANVNKAESELENAMEQKTTPGINMDGKSEESRLESIEED